MAEIQLFQIIFEQFLKISPELISKYAGSTQDQLLFLILIPHVILLLFLWSFGAWIARGHGKFHILISIVGYIFVIWGGWYGTFLVPILVSFFTIILALAFGFFILTYIINPGRGPAFYKLAGEAAREIKEKTLGKEQKRKAIEQEIDSINAQIRAIQNNPATTHEAMSYQQMQLQQLKAHKAALEEKESRL